jgi:pimeloyl-ACP methyl ester carboxylesterase
MMPFSVLRIWGTGLFSWAVLGLAIYCFWEWRQRIEGQELRAREPAVDRRQFDEINRPAPRPRFDREQPLARSESARAWPFLVAGIGLLAWSSVGFLPVLLVLGRPGGDAPREERDGEWNEIKRPDGSQLHVETYGNAKGPTIVFVHGWSLDSTAWHYAKRELSNRFRLVVWDLAGLGRSQASRSGDYRIEKMADDLAAVIENCSQGPVLLLGHSIGGMIVQTYCRLNAAQLGAKVQGIVLLHTTYLNPLNTAMGAWFWKAIERPILVPLNHLTVWLAPLAWLSNWQSYLNGSLHIATRLASFSGKQTWGQLNYGAWLAAKAWPGVVARGNLAMVHFNEDATLGRIDVPVLVIGGKHDRMTRPEASGHIESRLSHGVPYTLDTGHLGFWERHEELAEVVAEFAARVTREGGQTSSLRHLDAEQSLDVAKRG